jgi:hypothetical protein
VNLKILKNVKKFEIKNYKKLEAISRVLVKKKIQKIEATRSAKFIEVKTARFS